MKTKQRLILFFSVGALLTFSLILLNILPLAAQDNYQLDSDYDGLSDQVELNMYHSDEKKADTDGDNYLDSAEILSGNDPLDAADPGIILSKSVSLDIASQSADSSILPWQISRAAGITSYLLMFLIVILGTGMTTAFIYKYLSPVKAWLVHKYLSLALGLALIFHIFSLLFDKFINFTLLDLLLPFFSDFKPWFLSLGIFAFYVLLLIIFTSLWSRIKYQRIWRGIHYLTYLFFLFSFIHGLFIGTDSSTLAMQIIYGVSGLIFLSLLLYRFVIYIFKRR
jgi:predicted ferric reductase